MTAIISIYFRDLSPIWLAGLEQDFESKSFWVKNQTHEFTLCIRVHKLWPYSFWTMFEMHLPIQILALLVLVLEGESVVSDNMWRLGHHRVIDLWMFIFCLDPPVVNLQFLQIKTQCEELLQWPSTCGSCQAQETSNRWRTAEFLSSAKLKQNQRNPKNHKDHKNKKDHKLIIS